MANTSSKLSWPGVTHFPPQGSLFEKISKKTPIEMIPDVFRHKNLNAMELPVLIRGSLHLGFPWIGPRWVFLISVRKAETLISRTSQRRGLGGPSAEPKYIRLFCFQLLPYLYCLYLCAHPHGFGKLNLQNYPQPPQFLLKSISRFLTTHLFFSI